MMEWTKSPVALIQAFDAALPNKAAVERRKMFGYPAAFVGGNMATGLFQEHLIVRLPETRRAVLLGEPGSTRFEPMPGRPMKEYVVVSPAIVSDRRALQSWIGEALTYAGSLPPKSKKSATATARARKASKTSRTRKTSKTSKS
jgi:TfoX/Sxy family transcriptional regulator of competence genes